MLALLSLGSNLGDRVQNLISAIAALTNHVEVLAAAPLYETAPVGNVAQPDFVNTAVKVSFEQTPQELLEIIHDIEMQHGRTRDVHWGPRTLDIDIIDVQGFSCDGADLQIPHPRAKERSFVTVPCADIAPTWSLTTETPSRDGVTRIDDARWLVQL
mgnify:CR=1 FL=1